MSKYTIELLTIKGCKACSILRGLLDDALLRTSKEIEIVEKDMSSVSIKKLKANNITDFPTTRFIKDGNEVFRMIGSNPVAVIVRYIDVYFK